jgi:hypothetical protein
MATKAIIPKAIILTVITARNRWLPIANQAIRMFSRVAGENRCFMVGVKLQPFVLF